MAISSQEAEAINTNISEIFNKKEITEFAFTKKEIPKMDISKINDHLKEIGISFSHYQGKINKELFQLHVDGLGIDKLDFRLDPKKKYLSLRSHKSIDKSFFNLEGIDLYRNAFTNALPYTDNWLLYKPFEAYDLTRSTIDESIANDVINIIKKIQTSNEQV